MKVACIQLSAGPNSADNLAINLDAIDQAGAQGAKLVVTPEGTNYIRSHTSEAQPECISEDPHISAFAVKAKNLNIWLIAGSLLLAGPKGQTKKLNRQFLWNPKGELVATYDKIHMFDVSVGDGQVYRESEHYEPGTDVVISDLQFDDQALRLGHTICYDLRFPALFQKLALAGADVIVVPAAFTSVTGALHWHTLLRARAIENGCFIIAPGQTGTHDGNRKTYGHSLIIAPDGSVLADAGTEPGAIYADLDLLLVEKARAMIPNLSNLRPLNLKS